MLYDQASFTKSDTAGKLSELELHQLARIEKSKELLE